MAWALVFFLGNLMRGLQQGWEFQFSVRILILDIDRYLRVKVLLGKRWDVFDQFRVHRSGRNVDIHGHQPVFGCESQIVQQKELVVSVFLAG